MDQTDRVLELLYDRREGYSCPEELAVGAGLDRPGLDRALGELRDRGQELEFSFDGRLRLLRPAGLDAHLIKRGLETRRLGSSIVCLARAGSTNDVAFDLAAQGGSDGLVVLAEEQSRGRGRLGREWLSPPRANVLLSVLLLESACPLPHDALTIAAGLAVAEAVELAFGLETRLLWPNDVLLGGKKIAGILVEVRKIAQKQVVVVGVGVNVNACPPVEQVDTPAACIAEELGRPAERVELIQAVLTRLDRRLELVAEGTLDQLHLDWVSLCGMIQQRITVLCDGRRHAGRVLDVSPLEGLILETDDGQKVHLPAERSAVLA